MTDTSQESSAKPAWKLVPVDPTQEMVRAAYQDQKQAINAGFADAYRAMLAAAPSPAGTGEEELREVRGCAVWHDIVHCPTDGSLWEMKLPDGTTFEGQWSPTQRRWMRVTRYEPTGGAKTGAIIAPLPDGIFPTAYRQRSISPPATGGTERAITEIKERWEKQDGERITAESIAANDRDVGVLLALLHSQSEKIRLAREALENLESVMWEETVAQAIDILKDSKTRDGNAVDSVTALALIERVREVEAGLRSVGFAIANVDTGAVTISRACQRREVAIQAAKQASSNYAHYEPVELFARSALQPLPSPDVEEKT